MKGLIERLTTELNGLQVKLFEYDVKDEDSLMELKEFLYAKIRNSKLHKIEDYNVNYYSSQNMNPEFIRQLDERIKMITTPHVHKIPEFTVQRERVTEWMAELVLKEKYDCQFYEDADKRMNIDPVDIDKHTSGIDVPGICIQNGKIKFVVCEVKASNSKARPYNTIKELNNDIKKSIK